MSKDVRFKHGHTQSIRRQLSQEAAGKHARSSPMLCTSSRLGHWCLRLTAEQAWRRSHPDEDPALKRLPTATDGYLHPVLELDGVLESKDPFRDLARIHTAHHHLVVGQVEATADVLEILLSEHSAEREDVTGVLAIAQDDWRARIRCSVAVQVLRAVCHPGWH